MLQFEKSKLLDSLADGSLRFYCGLCGDTWVPGEQEKRNIQEWLKTQ